MENTTPSFSPFDPPKPPVVLDRKQAAPLLKRITKLMQRKLPKVKTLKLRPFKAHKKTKIV